MFKKNKPYEKATKEIYKKKPDIELVKKLLFKADEEGDDRASYAIATWYLHGKYLEKDFKKGAFYLEKSAEKNNPEALFDLAICFETGKGKRKNFKKAFQCYLNAALHGDTQSVEEVARCFYYGIGIEKNIDVAEIWYQRAEELGIEPEYEENENN